METIAESVQALSIQLSVETAIFITILLFNASYGQGVFAFPAIEHGVFMVRLISV